MATKKSSSKSPAKSQAKKSTSSKAAKTSTKGKQLKDPKGGLTAAGRKAFKEKEGANLRPGVQGPADTPDKLKRKGSFLTRHFTNPRGPMQKDGEPTRLALSAHAWGEPVPKTEAQAKKLAAKGRKLLEKYHKEKEKAARKTTEKNKASTQHSSSKKTSGKKAK